MYVCMYVYIYIYICTCVHILAARPSERPVLQHAHCISFALKQHFVFMFPFSISTSKQTSAAFRRTRTEKAGSSPTSWTPAGGPSRQRLGFGY